MKTECNKNPGIKFLFIICLHIISWSQSNEQSVAHPHTGSLGVVYDERYSEYVLHPKSFESPRRLSAIIDLLKTSDIADQILWLSPIPGIEQFLPLVHTQMHIEKIMSDKRTGNAALLAVGGVLSGVDAVMTSKVPTVFCAIRPPGHHAHNAGIQEGFCYFNNAALAVRYAQKKYGVKNVLIVDWDYHHGNGTEEIFREDSTVLFFSTHNARDFPGTGFTRHKDAKQRKGHIINVHLNCRTTDEKIIAVFKEKLLPAADVFKPDLVVISAGFDSRKDDPLGCFDLTDYGFYSLTALCVSIAEKYANGRIVSILEGGYNPEGNAKAAIAHCKALLKLN